MILKGRAWKFGDDVNTDLIIPGKYLELIDPREMASHAMEGIDPEFPNKIKRGDFIIGGFNFGCGSSREHAPLALKFAGVGAIIAESFARIFYRNSINVGLLALNCPGVSEATREGELLEIDVLKGTIKGYERGYQLRFIPLPTYMIDILNDGGLANHIRKNIEYW